MYEARKYGSGISSDRSKVMFTVQTCQWDKASSFLLDVPTTHGILTVIPMFIPVSKNQRISDFSFLFHCHNFSTWLVRNGLSNQADLSRIPLQVNNLIFSNKLCLFLKFKNETANIMATCLLKQTTWYTTSFWTWYYDVEFVYFSLEISAHIWCWWWLNPQFRET